jgi:hypothetical protein
MRIVALPVGVVGEIGNHILIARQAPVTRTILQQKDFGGHSREEVMMYRAEAVLGGVVLANYAPDGESDA